ncbi:hypothetical protein BaRGS_00025507 [Batillaria attramentaria]|uniref:Uncharacterized protein n=1 Tax=Batillaria attramentaria TaxID=370345 RepID=A0ABD0K819_9CAEN
MVQNLRVAHSVTSGSGTRSWDIKLERDETGGQKLGLKEFLQETFLFLPSKSPYVNQSPVRRVVSGCILLARSGQEEDAGEVTEAMAQSPAGLRPGKLY